MPQMPDPVSTCPIFDRLAQESVDPKWVEKALKAIEKFGFVKAAVLFKMLEKDDVWKCGGKLYSEVTYLQELWSQKWWTTDPQKPKDMELWLQEIVVEALAYSLIKEPQSCPVKGFWECVGSGFSRKADYSTGDQFVFLRIQTPPPPEECIHV